MNIRLFLFFLFVSFSSVAQVKIPEHGGQWVHDEANVLSPQAKAELETILKYERDTTSNQIAILIIPSLNGESLEDVSLRAAEQWKIGQKDKDNGVLWLISIEDRRQRIETGYGLEGVLTDAVSSRINRNEVAPYFRQNNYDEGVKAGVTAIIKSIKGEYKNDAPIVKKKRRNSPLATLFIIIIIIIIISRRRRGGGGGYWSSGGGFIGPMGGFGGSSGSWGGGGGGADFGGGGGFGGGGSSDSW